MWEWKECATDAGIKPLGSAVPTIIINQSKHTDMNLLVPQAGGGLGRPAEPGGTGA